jgi:transposase-like protein
MDDCDGSAIRDISGLIPRCFFMTVLIRRIDPKFSPRSILARDLKYFNILEKEELVQYVTLKGISEHDICSQTFSDFVVPNLNGRIQTICSICSTHEAEKRIMEWWIRQKKRDGIQDSRQKCPNGYHCKEQDDECHIAR